MNRVRVGSLYTFRPVFIDRIDGRVPIVSGTFVRVINLPNAPKANVMNHCHIESLDGNFLGMVHVNSLVKEK